MAALKGGAADYLKKPVQLAALKLVIDRVLTRRRCEDMPQGMRGTRMLDTLERRRRGDLIAAQATSWQGRLAVGPPAGAPREAAPGMDRASQMVGESQPMRLLKSLIGRVVEADLQHTGAEPPAVLITPPQDSTPPICGSDQTTLPVVMSIARSSRCAGSGAGTNDPPMKRLPASHSMGTFVKMPALSFVWT